ncbi:hypothetical protein BT63DRAFT_181058 [Microthyrium microscopicum]|uniref:Secreted protein n=1 Tax=Microthyrium microscopicum TaxID=703497 RepID=A0A6A6UL99_9PEZI|nr:hypothetical protein BT63DRAFT_181058 [Microthyrium microscopicum]
MHVWYAILCISLAAKGMWSRGMMLPSHFHNVDSGRSWGPCTTSIFFEFKPNSNFSSIPSISTNDLLINYFFWLCMFYASRRWMYLAYLSLLSEDLT